MPLFLCLTTLSILPLRAGDASSTTGIGKQRIRGIEFSPALQRYERVKMEAFETQLRLDLLNTDEEAQEADRKRRAESLARRHDMPQQRAAELRATAEKLGKKITVARAR